MRTIDELADALSKGTRRRLAREYPNYSLEALEQTCTVEVHEGRRWTRIDWGGSGRYMVDRDGAIHGIKGYGVPHLGRRYGTLGDPTCPELVEP